MVRRLVVPLSTYPKSVINAYLDIYSGVVIRSHVWLLANGLLPNLHAKVMLRHLFSFIVIIC